MARPGMKTRTLSKGCNLPELNGATACENYLPSKDSVELPSDFDYSGDEMER